jgi:hypothetical protein
MTDLQLLEGLMRGLGSCPTEALRILRYIATTSAAASTAASTSSGAETCVTSCKVQPERSDCSSSSSNSDSSSGSSNDNSARCGTAAASAVDVASSSCGTSEGMVEVCSDTAAVRADTVLHLWLLLLESR